MGKKIYVFMLSTIGMILSNTDLLYGQDPASPLLQYAGNHAQLSVARVTDHAFEIVLAPLSSVTDESPVALPVSDWNYPRQVLYESRSVMDPVHGRIGEYSIDILRSPLRITFRNVDQQIIQQITWPDDGEGKFEFLSGTPLPGFDLNANGNGNSEPVLAMGEKEWAILFKHPLSPDNQYFYDGGKGVFIPDPEKTEAPVQLFLILWEQREQFFEEYRTITGRSSLPHVWRDGVVEID